MAATVSNETVNLIPSSITDDLPAMVRNHLHELSPMQQEEFVEEYRRKAVSKSTLLLLALFGLHYIYLKNAGMQIVYWITMGGFLVWWFIDLFRLSSMAKNYNSDVAMNVFRNLKAIS